MQFLPWTARARSPERVVLAQRAWPGRAHTGDACGQRRPRRRTAPPRPGTPTHRQLPARPSNQRARSLAAVPKSPPSPKAMACAAPHRPMRMPSRRPWPAPARPIIEPMAAIENAPLARPRTNTLARSGQCRCRHAGQHQPEQRQRRGQAAADHPGAQRAEAPRRRAPAGQRRQQHAGQHAAMLHAGKLRRFARREAEHARRRKARGSGPARCRPASRRRRRS